MRCLHMLRTGFRKKRISWFRSRFLKQWLWLQNILSELVLYHFFWFWFRSGICQNLMVLILSGTYQFWSMAPWFQVDINLVYSVTPIMEWTIKSKFSFRNGLFGFVFLVFWSANWWRIIDENILWCGIVNA